MLLTSFYITSIPAFVSETHVSLSPSQLQFLTHLNSPPSSSVRRYLSLSLSSLSFYLCASLCYLIAIYGPVVIYYSPAIHYKKKNDESIR